MVASSYKFTFNRRTLYWSVAYIVLFTLLAVALYLLYEGGYLSAWFTSFIVALIALMTLSIPRKIIVNNDGIKIQCILDITEIRASEIASARCVDRSEMRGIIPLFGVMGFFGYYGHFIDLKSFGRVKIYASQWMNFVEIIDIYDERYYVSCNQADKLVNDIESLIEEQEQSVNS